MKRKKKHTRKEKRLLKKLERVLEGLLPPPPGYRLKLSLRP